MRQKLELSLTWRPINHHPQTGKTPSRSATSELLQLLTSPLKNGLQPAGFALRLDKYP